jgi:hypothetical protein
MSVTTYRTDLPAAKAAALRTSSLSLLKNDVTRSKSFASAERSLLSALVKRDSRITANLSNS